MFLPAAPDSLILNSNDPIHSIYFGGLFSGGNTFCVYDTAHCTRGSAYICLLRDDGWNAFFSYGENLLPQQIGWNIRQIHRLYFSYTSKNEILKDIVWKYTTTDTTTTTTTTGLNAFLISFTWISCFHQLVFIWFIALIFCFLIFRSQLVGNLIVMPVLSVTYIVVIHLVNVVLLIDLKGIIGIVATRNLNKLNTDLLMVQCCC